jgi:ATP-binding cassette subfamily B multidrug efflux pump
VKSRKLKILIVGKIGSGKTTILELLARLYDPTEGEILLNNIPLRNYNLNTLRESIGFVPQDSFLFSDTIGNNIKFGNINANHEMVIASAKKSFVHHDIDNFGTKYNSMLGERGINLSGGQKQRISIARALIKNPKLLLFDDCLSAVDTETEKEILDNITKDKERKTIVIVSHRVSSGSRTDQIIVLDKGEIIEKGNHAELVKKSGVYHSLIELQNNTK